MFLRAGLSVVRRFHGQSLLGNLPKAANISLLEVVIQWQKRLNFFYFVSKKFMLVTKS